MFHSGVYEIVCAVDGRRYVGASNNILYRLGYHLKRLRIGQHGNRKLQEAWNQFGERAFQFRPIVWATPDNAKRVEAALIRRLYDRGRAFNINGTPEHPRACRDSWVDPAARARRSASIRHVRSTPEARAACSAAAKKHWADPAFREKMSRIRRGRPRKYGT
jgi:hypothetical protein